MARIDALPSLEIIRGLKGILDFYLWKGLPCVRAWPTYRPARQTAASLAAALVFGAIVKSYGLLGPLPLEAYRDDAKDQTRTARDIMVTGIYGNLHEASMSDFLSLLQESRDFLSNLQALLNALDSLSLDELDVNVEASVLPAGAATAAAQATQLTALQKIDDLQDALQSKALDRLLVRGMDQLFTFKGVLAEANAVAVSGAGGFVDSDPCPAGEIWHVTNIVSLDVTSPTTEHAYNLRHDGANLPFGLEVRAIGAGVWAAWRGDLWLDPGDVVRAYFVGSLVGDTCVVYLTGYTMTLET